MIFGTYKLHCVRKREGPLLWPYLRHIVHIRK